ncbi:50S ribosomal protein L31 [Candidatus Nardonella dryophthoridicola]|uniref:50S ribosomal protein L31 n=1 Tax=endosymbiont of Rhynchophorus ferrugineus TaxID=1972133 RepID=A0A2Z5T3R6_9GAMM|nr:50S ribosomal protein L31 [Candidatus Nardonella dryophthoridicola]QTJ62794.1 50S ribosomal protein L31 [Candidatus Nardonella dryophthoridicola]BBA85037.1 50S ribosomal protein L31 [endosymbiont of Rhynchophorus ferrugineus]
MKKNIHPICYKILYKCSCNNKIYIWTTLKKRLFLDVCNLCHPFNTGKQKLTKNTSKIDKFNI